MLLTAAPNKATSLRQLGCRVTRVNRASLSKPCSQRGACAIAPSHLTTGSNAAIAQLCVDGTVSTPLMAAEATNPVRVLKTLKTSAEDTCRELAQNLHLLVGQNGQSLGDDLVP